MLVTSNSRGTNEMFEVKINLISPNPLLRWAYLHREHPTEQLYKISVLKGWSPKISHQFFWQPFSWKILWYFFSWKILYVSVKYSEIIILFVFFSLKIGICIFLRFASPGKFDVFLWEKWCHRKTSSPGYSYNVFFLHSNSLGNLYMF